MKTFKHTIQQAIAQSGRRYRQLLHLRRMGGIDQITDRIRRVAAEWIAPGRSIAPVRQADVAGFDLSCPFHPAIPPIHPRQPLTANWVITPPSRGSGGHTTIFRIICYLEAHGYRNRVYFYDPYCGDHLYFKSIVRDYYHFAGPVRNIDEGMEDAHMVFATGWSTAYPVFNSHCAGKRFYFIQDFEPFFYPAGSTSSLAENTYRMGFHGITIGSSISAKLVTEFSMKADSFNFGCDISQYSRDPASPRNGIVFYARRDSARRGLELGLMALELFAARNPGVEIHIYGDRIGRQPFAFTDHGRLTPPQLNLLYNRCYGGLSLSFTNVSLVPLEMLAAGCIPVINDTLYARADLKNPFVAYAPPYPQALSAQLEAILATEDFDFLSSAAAASVHAATWEEACAEVDQIIRRSILPAECTHSPLPPVVPSRLS